MGALKSVKFYKVKPAGQIETKSINIPSGFSAIVKALDFTAPAQQMAGVRVKVNGGILSAAQSDKYMMMPNGEAVEGPAILDLELDNSANANAAFLGVTIYYEEL